MKTLWWSAVVAGWLLLHAGGAFGQSLVTGLARPLSIAAGGTGATTFAANGVLYGNGTGSILATAQGPANSVLTANAGAPSFSATLTLGGPGRFNGNLTVRSGDTIGFSSSATDATVACDTCLVRDSANTPAFRNGQLNQMLKVYGKYTDASNNEGTRIGVASDAGVVEAFSAGTGTQRGLTFNGAGLSFQSNGSNYWDLVNNAGHWAPRTDNQVDLGTSALRVRAAYIGTTGIVTNGPIKFANSNSTAVVATLIGSTCPAVTCTAAYTWEKGISSDGSVVYFPLWK